MAKELGWTQRTMQSHKRKPGMDMTQFDFWDNLYRVCNGQEPGDRAPGERW